MTEREQRLVRFGDLSAPVRFTGCDDLLAGIRSILRGWNTEELNRSNERPVIRVTRTGDGYRRVSRWRSTPSLARAKTRKTLVEALCGFHFEFVDWYQEAHPEQLFIHGAGVRFGARLVAFPAVAKAGKSTLTVQLAADGCIVYGDDVLPIHAATGEGIALGIQPRLRPPLPPGSSDAFRAFVDTRRGLERKNRLYVSLRDGEIAPLGERAPIGAVVILERIPEGAATLVPCAPDDALEEIILQNFAREVPSPHILDALHRVVAAAACHRLTYARTDDASTVLRAAFGASAD